MAESSKPTAEVGSMSTAAAPRFPAYCPHMRTAIARSIGPLKEREVCLDCGATLNNSSR